MDITVVVCTYNRSESLANTLDNIAKSTLPQSVTWEVLVVDNNSSDATADVVKDCSRRFPGRIRYLFEPEPGKSYALNRAVRESEGAILAFVDDDATVDPAWLRRLIAPLNDSAWSGSGGPVILQWSCPRPNWISTRNMAPLAGFNPPRGAGETQELFGTNMAFRRVMFEKYGPFRTDLGPTPTGEIPRTSEDTEFVERVVTGGEHLFFEPGAVVYHPVPLHRLRKAYFLEWWFHKGRGDLLTLGVPLRDKLLVRGVPLVFLRKLVTGTLRWMFSIEPSKRFYDRVQLQWIAGAIFECRRQSTIAKVASRDLRIPTVS
jgi:glucosyl-dolichyl phosphate glucuronosyltransferase